MKTKALWSIAFVGSILAGAALNAAETHSAARTIQLSPALLELLRAEMREINAGVQMMASSIATADWKSIQETSAKIRTSYILEKKLTPAQAKELDRALPERFKQMDADFHERAEKIGVAAKARDAELVTYHYSRLVEACTVCHAAYAGSRFAGFASQASPASHHPAGHHPAGHHPAGHH